MTSKVKELFDRACDLPEDERATLAGLLIESLESEWDTGAREAWIEALQRRIAELDAGEVETIPWETVRERLVRTLNEG